MSWVDDKLGSDLDVVKPILAPIVKDAVNLALSRNAPVCVLPALAYRHDQSRLAGASSVSLAAQK